MNSLEHLDPKIRQVAELDAATRIRLISKDLFIEHEYSLYLTDVLDALLCEPRHGRMPCWLITGDAGMGRTAHLHRFGRRYPEHRRVDGTALVRPILMVNTPPEPTRVTLEIALLEAFNAPTVTHGQRMDRGGVIRRLMAAHEVRVLVLDEIQHICHSRVRERAVLLDTIKAFSTTCKINVICAGTPTVAREFKADAQLERRFSMTQFERWRVGPSLQQFLATFERARPLRLPSRLAEPTMMRAVLEEAGGVTHKIMECLNAAAIVAVNEGIERITAELVAVLRSEPGRVLTARRSVVGDRVDGNPAAESVATRIQRQPPAQGRARA
jgi:hypothetical protein